MYAECVDTIGHADALDVCSSNKCGRLICHTCNPDGRCARGCEIGHKRKSSGHDNHFKTLDRAASKKRGKSKGAVLLFDEDESERRDLLRLKARGTPFYGYVREIEKEEVRGGPSLYHVDFECFTVEWFDALQGDLSDLPKWISLPVEACVCFTSLIVAESDLRGLTLGKMQLQEHTWVRLWIEKLNPPFPPDGAPVLIYLPPERSTNPLLIPGSGRMSTEYEVLRIDRVRPTSDGSRKLKLLWPKISAQDYRGDLL